MKVFKNECYKIFAKKSIYIVFILIVLLMYYVALILPDEVMKDEVYEELYKEWGGPAREERISLAREQMGLSDAGESPSKTLEDRAEGEVHFLVAMSGLNSDSLKERKELLQDDMDKLNTDSYEYKEASKELTMLKELGEEPYGFYLIRAWRGMFDFIEPIMSVVFLSALILLGLTPVFADEYTNNTLGLILATKRGKRQIVTAKIMASITYIFTVFLSLHIVNFILQLIKHGGIQGWDVPFQNLSSSIFSSLFAQSPYALDVWQFYAVTLSIQLLASLAIGILVLFLSLVCKNSMTAFFIGGSTLGVPLIFGEFSFDRGILKYMTDFNYVEFMKVQGLFEEFKAFNILGHPVLYPNLLLIIFFIITLIILVLIYKRHGRIQISN